MTALRPKRASRAPQRFGWDDDFEDGALAGVVVMNEDSENEVENETESDDESETETESENATDSDSGNDGEGDGWLYNENDQAPDIPPFTGVPGVHLPPGSDANSMDACDFLFLFLDENFFELLSTETNRYADQYVNGRQFPQNSRVHKWQNTSASEMKAFIALLLAMGIDDRPTYSSYWSHDIIYDSPFWASVFSRDRFLLLLKFFHLADNDNRPQAEPGVVHDKLYKVRPLIDLLNERFPAIYTPARNVCIDETMVPWTGRLGFKQYIPIKPQKYGIKLYQLCESDSGYSIKFKVYQGREGNNVDRNHTMNVVMQLMGAWLDKGHLLWLDNYYSGVPLFEELRNRGTLAAGTVRPNRAGIPPIIRTKKLRKGEAIYRRKGNLMVMKWRDNSDVKFLSSAHSATMVDGRKRDADGVPIKVPNIKLRYDLNMNGVDKNDQNVGYYAPRRKSLKWYVKLAIYLVSLTRFQAYIVYRKATQNPVSQLKFIDELVLSMVERANLPSITRGRPRSAPIQRLTARHFPEVIPATNLKDKPTKRCSVCCVATGQRRQPGVRAPRRHETRYQCPDCRVALCIVPCFKLYHTYTDFKQAYAQMVQEA